MSDAMSQARDALREFVQWVATQRAYNGSDHRHAQSLYNECLNAVLPQWAEEFIATRPIPPEVPAGFVDGSDFIDSLPDSPIAPEVGSDGRPGDLEKR